MRLFGDIPDFPPFVRFYFIQIMLGLCEIKLIEFVDFYTILGSQQLLYDLSLTVLRNIEFILIWFLNYFHIIFYWDDCIYL